MDLGDGRYAVARGVVRPRGRLATYACVLLAWAWGGGCTVGFEEPEGVCGDQVIEGTETCDDGNAASGDGCGGGCDVEDGWQCAGEPSTCVTECGDGLAAGDEACDGTDLAGARCADLGFVEGVLSCASDCSFDTSACVYDDCGNGVIDFPEQCDSTELGGATCQDVGLDDGTLACRGDCTYDLSGCIGCGNGIVEAAEECDGTNLQGQTCLTEGFVYGTLTCADCVLDTSACLNCGGSTGVICPVSVLSDDFNDGLQDPIWSGSWTTGSATMEEVTTLRLYPPVNGIGYASYQTGETYDLVGGAISVKVAQATGESLNVEASMNLTDAAGVDYAGVIKIGSLLQLAGEIGGNWLIYYEVTYDEVDHRYWRLSAQGGGLTLETSPDGAVWTVHHTQPVPIAFGSVYVDLKAGAYAPVADPGWAEFDDFNILP